MTARYRYFPELISSVAGRTAKQILLMKRTISFLKSNGIATHSAYRYLPMPIHTHAIRFAPGTSVLKIHSVLDFPMILFYQQYTFFEMPAIFAALL